MDLRTRLVGELQHRGGGRLVQLDPSELAASAASVLGSPGATLTLVQPLIGLPLAASDHDAVVAEQVQASVGDGPMHQAAQLARPVAAQEHELHSRWPLYHHYLTSRTPFRSTMSFPLSQSGTVFAALDVYGEEPSWGRDDALTTIQAEVADLLALMLLGIVSARDPQRTWPVNDSARRRQQVWIAVGMVCEAAGLDDDDAMAVLRAYAFAHDQLLDHVADDLLTGRIRPVDVARPS